MATLSFDANGNVLNISGPWNEIYSKKITYAKTAEKGEGEEWVRVDKMTLTERRVTKLATRGAFVSFLMWMFIFIAATIAKRASW